MIFLCNNKKEYAPLGLSRLIKLFTFYFSTSQRYDTSFDEYLKYVFDKRLISGSSSSGAIKVISWCLIFFFIIFEGHTSYFSTKILVISSFLNQLIISKVFIIEKIKKESLELNWEILSHDKIFFLKTIQYNHIWKIKINL